MAAFLFVCDAERGRSRRSAPMARQPTEHRGQSSHWLPARGLMTGTFLPGVENSLELCGLAEAIPSTVEFRRHEKIGGKLNLPRRLVNVEQTPFLILFANLNRHIGTFRKADYG